MNFDDYSPESVNRSFSISNKRARQPKVQRMQGYQYKYTYHGTRNQGLILSVDIPRLKSTIEIGNVCPFIPLQISSILAHHDDR